MSHAAPDPALDPERLRAHAEWLARGRTGAGRLVVDGETLTGSLEQADLRGAEFQQASLVGVSLLRARLDGARLRRCGLERTDLRHASLIEARFEDCDLRRAMLAGAIIGRSGFLRCAFGDFGSQTIGKPDVRGPYVVVAPDLSSAGDGSRLGVAADVDARWFTAPSGGAPRRFAFDSSDGARYVASLLHMHVLWAREAGPRFQDRVASQTFGQFLADGAPAPFAAALPRAVELTLREAVTALASAWTPEPSAP